MQHCQKSIELWEEIRKELEDYHRFLVPIKERESVPASGEIEIPSRCLVEKSEKFADQAADFSEALRKFGIETNGQEGSAFLIRFDEEDLDGSIEVVVSQTGIQIRVATIAEAWSAIVWLEREMAWRHAAVLPEGTYRWSLSGTYRITSSFFASAFENPACATAYSDRYFKTMVHSGYQACFLYLNWWDYIQSDLLPELNAEKASQNLEALAALSARAKRWGIEMIALMNTPGLEKEHPVFVHHSEVRGGSVMGNGMYCLCASSKTVRAFFTEQTSRLFTIAPELGGLALLIGGEGFRHCYMRPNPRTEAVTNCRKCAKGSASTVLTPLLNAVIAGVRRASDTAKVIFWPYSSVVWQNQPQQDYDWSLDQEIIRHIDKGAIWMTEIEKDAPAEIAGVGDVPINDYCIQYIGPSPKAKQMALVCRENQVALGVKTETSISIEEHSLPYIPVMHRWLKRTQAIRQLDGELQWENWRLNGFWPSPSNEIFYWESHLGEDTSILSRIGQRIYGKEALPDLLAAWKCFSKAWDFSHPLYGTYWSGPLFIGPAHPFDIGMAFLNLKYYSDDFYQVSPGRWESESNPQYFVDPRNLRPKFYLFPGRWPRERIRDYGALLALWKDGMRHLEAALTHVPVPLFAGAQSDVDMALAVAICFEEDKSFHEFALLRDQLHQFGIHSPAYRNILSSLKDILEAAISRARECISIMKRTPMIGAGSPVYGVRFTIPMIEEKIKKTQILVTRIDHCLKNGEAFLPA